MGKYRLILSDELRRRQEANRAYSLRAFARLLDFDASTLCKVLRGKRSISTAKAEQMVMRLGLDEGSMNEFMNSLQEEKVRRAELATVTTVSVPTTQVGN